MSDKGKEEIISPEGLKEELDQLWTNCIKGGLFRETYDTQAIALIQARDTLLKEKYWKEGYNDFMILNAPDAI